MGKRLRFRFFNKIYAWVFGYFWKSCPKCGKMFGGNSSVPATSTTGWVCCIEC